MNAHLFKRSHIQSQTKNALHKERRCEVEHLEGRRLFAVTILHSFINSEGSDPLGGLTADSSGNLYGTTTNEGTNQSGSVYELVKGAGGTFTYKTLWNFDQSGHQANGSSPRGRLAIDSSGDLFGTCSAAGDADFDGTLWEMTAASIAAPTHTLTLLASFDASSTGTGENPEYGVTIDSSGNLYGTCPTGGLGNTGIGNGTGTIWKYTKSTSTLSRLFAFPTNTSDGENPSSGAIVDSSGNLYGETRAVGAFSLAGGVWKWSPTTGISILYDFGNTGNPGFKLGYDPRGDLTRDSSGNIYGTTYQGGANFVAPSTDNYGVIFKISSTGVFSRLASFNNTNGSQPTGGIAIDSSGRLLGTTFSGGANGTGNVYRYSPSTGVVTDLADFDSTASHPKNPQADDLYMDSSGNIFGTTTLGSASPFSTDNGTVWEFAPPALPLVRTNVATESVAATTSSSSDTSWSDTVNSGHKHRRLAINP